MRNNFWYDKYVVDLSISIAIAALPFTVYLHLLVSQSKSYFKVFGLEFDHGFVDDQTYCWFLLSNIIHLVLFILMFFSVTSFWKYFLLPLIFLVAHLIVTSIALPELPFSFEGSTLYMLLSFLIVIILVLDYYNSKSHDMKILIVNPKSILAGGRCINIEKTKHKINKKYRSTTEISKNNRISHLYSIRQSLEKVIEKYRYYEKQAFSRQSINTKNALIVLTLIFTVALWFYHYTIPDGLRQIQIGKFIVTDHGFWDVGTFVWFVTRKIIIILPLIIWYTTSYDWYRHAILSPIILYTFQFWEAFQDVPDVEAQSNMKVFPLVFLSILLVLALSRIVRTQSRALDAYDQISMEIERLITKISEERSGLGEYKKRYKQVVESLVKSNTKEEQLKELTRLKQELQGKVG